MKLRREVGEEMPAPGCTVDTHTFTLLALTYMCNHFDGSLSFTTFQSQHWRTFGDIGYYRHISGSEVPEVAKSYDL